MVQVLMPRIGVTLTKFANTYLANFPHLFVGTFLIPGGYGFEAYQAPSAWIDAVTLINSDPDEKDESTPHLLELIENRLVSPKGHSSEDNMELMYWIGVLVPPSNPADFTFIVHHVRMSLEIPVLLHKQAEYNIPTCTEVLDFDWYSRRLEGSKNKPPRNLNAWRHDDWVDFCMSNLTEHGQSMLYRYFNRSK